MRRFLVFVRLALIFLTTTPVLLAQHGVTIGAAPLAQHGVTIGAAPASHLAVPVYGGPVTNLPGPSHTFTPPSGPMTVRPGVRFPVSPNSEGQHWPSVGAGPVGAGPYHRPGGDQGGANHYDHDRYPNGYAGYPWLSSFGYGFPVAYGAPYIAPSIDDQGEVSSPQPAPQPADSGNVPPPENVQEPSGPSLSSTGQLAANAGPSFRPPYQGQINTAPVHAQPATTLIFKDGRPSLQVHNYALTATTVYTLDGESPQEIPLSLLNVPATVEANRAAGIDFALPASR